MLMEDVPANLTTRDVTLYVHDTLENISDLELADLDKPAMAACESFRRVSTACRYIRNRDGRQGPRDRFPLFLTSNHGLDELYTRILTNTFGRNLPRASRGLS